MTLAMQNVTAFERGQKDFQKGRRNCPFTVRHRQEAWRDGWLTEQSMYMSHHPDFAEPI